MKMAFLSICLIAVLLFDGFLTYLVTSPAYAKPSTVTVKCRNIAVALATLDTAIALADNASLDASLSEGQIAADLQSERQLLVDLTQRVKDSCHSFSDVLQDLTFK
jgi:hypothetical protein